MTRKQRNLSQRDQDVRQLIGQNVRSWRIHRGHSMDWLAEQARVSKTAVHNIETGKQATSADVLARIAAALEIAPATLWAIAEGQVEG